MSESSESSETPEPDPAASDPTASTLFVAHLAKTGDRPDLDALVEQAPDLESEFRDLHRAWQDARSALPPPIGDSTTQADTVSTATQRDGSWNAFLSRLRDRVEGTKRYVIQGEIARGGMGVIQQVYDQDMRRPLAMKVILGKGDTAPTGRTPPVDDRTLGRFLEEAQVTGQLDHPGIVPVHELGVDSTGRVFFTMKLVRGRTFAEILEDVHAGSSEWTETRAVSLLLRVCEAMSYAHRKGVVHRDLKPANVMVGRYGEVYVMDWGLARVLSEDERHNLRIRPAPPTARAIESPRRTAPDGTPGAEFMTMDGDVVGTPAYMSPEQAAGKRDEVGPRTDVYAVGAMLYHLLTGSMPYVEPTARVSPYTVLAMVLQGPPIALSQAAPSAPAPLTAICERAMARGLGARYESMEALGEDLRAYLENRVVRAHRTGPVAEMVQWTRRNRATAATIAAAVVVVGLLTAVFVEGLRTRGEELSEKNVALESKNDALESANYVTNIRAASAALDLNRMQVARQHLDACPEAKRGWEWTHLELRMDKPTLVIQAHDGGKLGITDSLIWTKDGARIISASNDGRVRVWEASTGHHIRDLITRPNQGSIRDLTLSPDGSLLAAIAGNFISVWRISDLSLIAQRPTLDQWRSNNPSDPLAGDYSNFDTLAFDSTSQHLLVGVGENPTEGSARSAELLRLSTNDLSTIDSTQLGGYRVYDVSIHPGGKLVAVAVADVNGQPWLEVWNIETKNKVRELRDAFCSVFTPDGSRLLTWGSQGLVPWLVDDWTALDHVFLGGVHVSDVTVCGDLLVAAVSTDDQVASPMLTVVDLERMEVVGHARDRTNSHRYQYQSAAMNPTGTRIAGGNVDGQIHVYSDWLYDPSLPIQVAWGWGEVQCVAEPVDGPLVLLNRLSNLFSPGFTVREHEGAILMERRATNADFGAPALSLDGGTVAVIEGERLLRVWRTDSAREVLRLELPACNSGRQVALDAHGERLLVTTQGLIEVRELPSGAVIAKSGKPLETTVSALSGDGRIVAVYGRDPGFLATWSLESDRWLGIPITLGSVDSMALNPDGTRLACSNSWDNLVKLYDTSVGVELCTISDGFSGSLQWSEDGQSLLATIPGIGIVYRWAATQEDALRQHARDHWSLRPSIMAMIEKHEWPDEVRAALASDPEFDDESRAKALRVLDDSGNDMAEHLGWLSYGTSCDPTRSPEEYALALRRAEAALQVERGGASSLMEYGAALFRCGRTEEALAALREVDFRETRSPSLAGRDRVSGWEGPTDDLRAWVALCESSVGRAESAKRWIADAWLSEDDPAHIRRVVREARVAIGMEPNPEGLDLEHDEDSGKDSSDGATIDDDWSADDDDQ